MNNSIQSILTFPPLNPTSFYSVIQYIILHDQKITNNVRQDSLIFGTTIQPTKLASSFGMEQKDFTFNWCTSNQSFLCFSSCKPNLMWTNVSFDMENELALCCTYKLIVRKNRSLYLDTRKQQWNSNVLEKSKDGKLRAHFTWIQEERCGDKSFFKLSRMIP